MNFVKILALTLGIFCFLRNADSATYKGLTDDNYLLVDELYTLATNKRNDMNNLKGHPLGHVRGAGGDIVNYSKQSNKGPKSALVDKDTTMRLIHLLLRHDTGRAALNALNGVGGAARADDQVITFTLAQVQGVINASPLLSAVPVVYKYQNGVELKGTSALTGFRFVLRHEKGKKTVDSNSVFMQTAFPLS